MMPTMPPDSHKISLKIIEAIKQHPVLYINDVKGTSIKVQEFRQKVWKRISDELTLDPTWVRLRWKNLRDTYCRILKYKNKTDKGTRRKKWVFEDHLSFLKFPYEADYQPQCVELTAEYIQDINSSGIDFEGLLEQLEDKDDEDYSEYLEVLEETTADPVLGDSELPEVHDSVRANVISERDVKTSNENDMEHCVQDIQSKYRKIRPKKMKMDESTTIGNSNNDHSMKSPIFRTTRLDNLNTVDLRSPSPILIKAPSSVPVTNSLGAKKSVDKTKGSSTELFFNSMARTVKLLPLQAQVDIKMAVCKIVTEAEMKYFKRSLAKNTQRFVTPPGMIPKLVLVPCSTIDNPGNRD